MQKFVTYLHYSKIQQHRIHIRLRRTRVQVFRQRADKPFSLQETPHIDLPSRCEVILIACHPIVRIFKIKRKAIPKLRWLFNITYFHVAQLLAAE